MRHSVTIHIEAPAERIRPLVSEGTDVTESFELARWPVLRLYRALLGWARRNTNVENMRTTLQRVKAAAEA